MNRFIRYVTNVAIALSQLLNATVFCGDPNETLSGRCWRENRKVPGLLIDTLFFFQGQHCLHSHLADRILARKILEGPAA